MTNPSETQNIPPNDKDGSAPLYVRYTSTAVDFVSENFSPAEIYALCGLENESIPDFPEGRHFYDIGKVIVYYKDVTKSAQSFKDIPWDMLMKGSLRSGCQPFPVDSISKDLLSR